MAIQLSLFNCSFSVLALDKNGVDYQIFVFSLLTSFSFEYVLDCVEESALVLNRPPYNALKIGEVPSMVAVLVLLPTGVQIYRK